MSDNQINNLINVEEEIGVVEQQPNATNTSTQDQPDIDVSNTNPDEKTNADSIEEQNTINTPLQMETTEHIPITDPVQQDVILPDTPTSYPQPVTNWLGTVRSFLEKNKIFFEILVILLSPLTIIILLFQTNISKNQQLLAEQQMEISKQQSLPHFIIAPEIIEDNNKQHFVNIIINNAGGLASVTFCKVKTDITSFVHVKEPTKFYWESIPVSMDYEPQYTGNGTGIVLKLTGKTNINNLIEIQSKSKIFDTSTFENLNGISTTISKEPILNLSKKDKTYGTPELAWDITLNYKDIYGKNHTEIFVMSQKFPAYQVQKDATDSPIVDIDAVPMSSVTIELLEKKLIKD